MAERHDHVGERRFIDAFLAKVEQGENMRVIEYGNSSHLALEKPVSFPTRLSIRIRFSIRAHHLDSYLTSNAYIFCLVDLTHSTAPYEPCKPIVAELQSFKRHIFTPYKAVDRSYNERLYVDMKVV